MMDHQFLEPNTTFACMYILFGCWFFLVVDTRCGIKLISEHVQVLGLDLFLDPNSMYTLPGLDRLAFTLPFSFWADGLST